VIDGARIQPISKNLISTDIFWVAGAPDRMPIMDSVYST
jgi:hypothetical protein